jgi:hypothetical protein
MKNAPHNDISQVVIQFINALHLLALEASGNRADGFLTATYTRYCSPPFSISIFPMAPLLSIR